MTRLYERLGVSPTERDRQRRDDILPNDGATVCTNSLVLNVAISKWNLKGGGNIFHILLSIKPHLTP